MRETKGARGNVEREDFEVISDEEVALALNKLVRGAFKAERPRRLIAQHALMLRKENDF